MNEKLQNKLKTQDKILDSFNEMKKSIEEIKTYLNNLKNNFLDYIEKSEKSIEIIQNEMKNCILSLERAIEYNEEDFDLNSLFNKIKTPLDIFYSRNLQIYENTNIKNIGNLNEKIKEKKENIKEDIEFDPPFPNNFESYETKINSYNNNSISIYESENNQKYINSEEGIYSNKSYFNDNDENNHNNESDNEEINNIIKCTVCNKNEAKIICEHCSQLFCNYCFNLIDDNIKKQHQTQQIDIFKTRKKKKKVLFINSLNQIIKSIISASNYLISHEIIKTYNISNNLNANQDIISYIKRKFDYPYIEDLNSLDSQIVFLKEIYKLLKDNFNVNNIDIHTFHISELNKKLLHKIGDIFKDDNINLAKEAIEQIEYQSDEDDYDDEIYNPEKHLPLNENEFNEMKNKFYYVIYLVSQMNNIKYDQRNIKAIFIKKVKDKLSIDENNIFVSFNNKNSFISSFIKTKEFNSFSLRKLQYYYPDFKKLLEYKIIFENILSHEKYKEYLDYRGNTICPNSRYILMRGTEKYNPPYGWFGIGLNVFEKYNNEEWLETNSNNWAVAYYGVGQNSSSKEIKIILQNIIIKNKLNPQENQFKRYDNDKRHNGNQIGVGIYLSPDINIAEKFSGKISINNKKYRVVLMAKVLISKIREPEDINFWILNKEDIRFYRILVKEAY